MMKKLCVILMFFTLVFCTGYKKPNKYVIKAEKDAFYHNNVGLNYLKDRIYYAAIQEFKIAISLSPSTQASAIFYTNLGETYNFIGYPEMALDAFEEAIKLYGLNFRYYINLVDSYIKLGESDLKIREFEASKDVYDRIKLGILYVKKGEIRKGINTLDEITIQEPDLLITPAIKQYIKQVIDANNLSEY